MDYGDSKFKVKTFTKVNSKELERELQDFIKINFIKEIVSFNVTSIGTVGGDKLVGVLIYK